MKKKGFTLIELLAVIVILAILMVIAIPRILDVIEKVDMKAYEESVTLMVRSAKLQKQNTDMIGENKMNLPATFEYGINEEGQTHQTEESINASGTLKFKGDKPQSGRIILNENGKVIVEELVSKNGKWCAVKSENEKGVTVGKATKMGCKVASGPVIIEDKKACEMEIDSEDNNIMYIDSESDLYALSKSVNAGTSYAGKTIKVRNNLDMSKVKNKCDSSTTSFKPIGTNAHPFNGTFDGGAKTISNLTIDEPSMDNVGLFGYITTGTVKGLQLENIVLKGHNQVGIFGSMSSANIISIQANNLTVIGTNDQIGGIVGWAYGGTVKEICLDNFNIKGNSTVSGAIGHIARTVVYNNILLKKGTVQANNNIGYFVGVNSNDTQNSIAENVTLTTTGSTIYNPNKNYHTYKGEEKNINFYEAAGLDTWIGGDNDSSGYYFDYESDGEIRLRSVEKNPIKFTLSGSGTETDPYLISNEKEWKEATSKLGSYYKVTSNLDFENDNNISKKYYMMGSQTNKFIGNIDGQYNKIKNVLINAPQVDSVGIFGYISGRTVKGLQLENIVLKGHNQVGIFGSMSSANIISIQANNLTVIGTNDQIGGIVGWAYGGTVKEICLDNFNIKGNSTVSGAIGHIARTVVYNNILLKKGTVQANNNIGYFVGVNSNDTQNSIAENVTLTTTGSTIYEPNKVRNTYKGKEKNINFYEAAGLDTWIGGDNDSTGYYFDYESDGEIRLRSVEKNPIKFTLSGSGTEANPYLITNEKEWKEATSKLSSYYKVTSDLDFENDITISKKYYMMGSQTNQFTGNIDGQYNKIKNVLINAPQVDSVGIFGYISGRTVKGLQLENIVLKGYNQVGIFGSMSSANIISIQANNLTVMGTNDQIGGIVGWAYGGTVKEICLDNFNIKGNSTVSGAIGHIARTVVYNNILLKKGTVHANNNIGYFVGVNNNDIQNSIAENVILTTTGSTIYEPNIGSNTHSSTLSTANGSAPANSFSQYYIGDLSYYTNKIETVNNGDANNTGYFFDYVESKGGIYLVEEYTPTPPSSGGGSTGGGTSPTVRPSCTCSGGCYCADNPGETPSYNGTVALRCHQDCHLSD